MPSEGSAMARPRGTEAFTAEGGAAAIVWGRRRTGTLSTFHRLLEEGLKHKLHVIALFGGGFEVTHAV